MPDLRPAVPPDPPSDPAAAPRPALDRPQRYLFLLLDRFTMISFAAAIEPLRLANRLSGRVLYDWRLVGAGGTSVRCSNGASMALDGDLLESVAVEQSGVLGQQADADGSPQACHQVDADDVE